MMIEDRGCSPWKRSKGRDNGREGCMILVYYPANVDPDDVSELELNDWKTVGRKTVDGRRAKAEMMVQLESCCIQKQSIFRRISLQ